MSFTVLCVSVPVFTECAHGFVEWQTEHIRLWLINVNMKVVNFQVNEVHVFNLFSIVVTGEQNIRPRSEAEGMQQYCEKHSLGDAVVLSLVFSLYKEVFLSLRHSPVDMIWREWRMGCATMLQPPKYPWSSIKKKKISVRYQPTKALCSGININPFTHIHSDDTWRADLESSPPTWTTVQVFSYSYNTYIMPLWQHVYQTMVVMVTIKRYCCTCLHCPRNYDNGHGLVRFRKILWFQSLV